MGKLIATTQATVDGVIDPVGEWVQPDGDHGVYSFERQTRCGGLVLGRTTYEGLAGYWPSQSGKWADLRRPHVERDAARGRPRGRDPQAEGRGRRRPLHHGSGEFAYALAEKRLIDEFEIYLNPLVWGKGNVHVLGDRGTVRMQLGDVKRFDSGVVLLTYLPASE
jgi:dihydrofolate reductase